ncbi:hypothetical protein ACJX0J_028372, partial [Zea mays]
MTNIKHRYRTKNINMICKSKYHYLCPAAVNKMIHLGSSHLEALSNYEHIDGITAIPLASFYNEKHFNHYLQKKHFDHIEENHRSERKTMEMLATTWGNLLE